MARFLIILGLSFLMIGLMMSLGMKIPGLRQLGRLPGDIFIKKDEMGFYFPIVSCIIVSIIVNLVFKIIRHFSGRP